MEDDLVKVKNDLWKARILWRGIGENLGLSPAEIEEISIDENNNPGNCLRKVLLKWLRRESKPDKPITWKGLILALQEGQLKNECGALVECLKKKYDIVVDPSPDPLNRLGESSTMNAWSS